MLNRLAKTYSNEHSIQVKLKMRMITTWRVYQNILKLLHLFVSYITNKITVVCTGIFIAFHVCLFQISSTTAWTALYCPGARLFALQEHFAFAFAFCIFLLGVMIVGGGECWSVVNVAF